MITKNYIKMCEKAEEIQKEHKWKDSDNLAYRRCINVRDCNYKELINNPEYYEMTYNQRMPQYNIDFDRPIYLPTQEQLQEMIKEKRNWFVILEDFCKTYADLYINLDSINEVWLAFVMKEKYDKIWNGDDWK